MPRVTITIPDQNPQPYRFHIDRRLVVIGRGTDNDITIDSGSVSTLHAEMRRVTGGYELHDTGSTNGLKLHGERQQVVILQNGMVVKIGEATFDFLLSNEEVQELAAEKPASVPYASIPAAEEEAEDETVVEIRQTGSRSGGLILLLVLVAIAFFIGLSIRHRHDTGNSLIQAMRLKFQPPTHEKGAR